MPTSFINKCFYCLHPVIFSLIYNQFMRNFYKLSAVFPNLSVAYTNIQIQKRQ